MPWLETDPMNECKRFILEATGGLFSHTELCLRHGVSRKTGYQWIERYESEGPDGLGDRPHRVRAHPHTTEPHVVEAALELRGQRRRWGADKIRARLLTLHPDWSVPSARILHKYFLREGLVKKPRRSRRRPHPGRPTAPFDAPNAIWSADFKGQFKTLDGCYCYPLTVQDGFSRYLLPFASIALGRLSRLSVWWIKLGILPDLIEPASPQQNGRHERMHKDLKAEATIPPAGNRSAQQKRFNAFLTDFNEIRPHEALAQKPPVSAYQPRPGPFPRS